jgi:Kef-type K+ transport system membrane component KefB
MEYRSASCAGNSSNVGTLRVAYTLRIIPQATNIIMEIKVFLFSLIVIYISARLLGELAVRCGQSSVLGELLAGVLVGPSLLGLVYPTETLTLMGEIGVMLLLFEVGLESDLQSFLRVGPSAAVVALIGVVVPFGLGYGVAAMVGLTPLQAIFVGATLTATSVAISARVLSDFGRLQSREGTIILGAAVLDDILGLVILSVMVGLAESGTVSWLTIAQTAGLAILFLSAAVAFGNRYATLFSKLVNRLNTRGALVITALTFALLLGYLAEEARVAPLVGAFAAGLILARTEHQGLIEERLKPITDVFVPIFFVLVGVAVDLSHLNPFHAANQPVLLLAAGLTVVAIIGKLVAGWGVLDREVNRWVVGVGMVPRGEVGLIFAGVGLASHIITDAQYGAILVVVALTTLLSPILLKRLLRNRPIE